MNSQTLKRKLKALEGQLSETHAIRIHRALSWLKAAEEQDKNQDLRLICLWVSANSLYAMDEASFEALPERERFADFQQSITDASNALAKKNVNYLLRIVLDRLYVLRNQLIHGGATYKSQINRAQVRDGANILISLLPVIIEIMMDNPKSNWGKIYYPPIK